MISSKQQTAADDEHKKSRDNKTQQSPIETFQTNLGKVGKSKRQAYRSNEWKQHNQQPIPKP